jgi:hypothetical protein
MGYRSGMETIITYRRRSVTRKDIATIRRIIALQPEKSRRFVSQEICRQWDWWQLNGILKDMVCRSLLLLLESNGFIKLPARKFTPVNPLAKRRKPSRVVVEKLLIIVLSATCFLSSLKKFAELVLKRYSMLL